MRAAGLIRVKRLVLAVGCAILSLGALAGPAWGAVSDPLFVFVPVPPPPPAQVSPPPTGYLNGPCGLAVDGSARFYVSDYYHHVIDVFSSAPSFANQLTNEDPTDGPCGLALDPANRLYVNNYHRNVVRYNASPSFGAGAVIAGAGVDGAYPTGVAVDPLTGIVYVNAGTLRFGTGLAGNTSSTAGTGNLVINPGAGIQLEAATNISTGAGQKIDLRSIPASRPV